MGQIKIITAVQKNDFGIGKDLNLLFSISEDMQNFRNLTKGHIVVMGWKTWDSLDPKYKPLPMRQNVVLTRSVAEIPGAIVKRNINDVLKIAKENTSYDIFIIGGGQIYKEFLQFVTEIHLTNILSQTHREANIFFPKKDIWERDYSLSKYTEHIGFDKIGKEEVSYSFEIYKRNLKPMY